MSDFPNRKEYIGLGRETTRGTGVAAAYWLLWEDQSVDKQITKIKNESAAGNMAKYNGSEIVEEMGGGSIGGKVTIDAIGMLLAGMFGSAPSTVANADASGLVYDHTYDLDDSSLGTSLTVYRKNPNLDVRYPLGMFDKSEFSVNVGEWVKFGTEFMSKPEATTTSTPALTEQTEFVPRHAEVKLAANVAGLGAAQAVPVKNFKFTVDRKVEAYFATGSNAPDEIHAQEIEITGEMTLRYTDDTYRALWEADTEQAIQLTLANNDVTIGTAANPTLVFTINRAVLEDWTHEKDKSKIAEQTIGFTAMFDFATAKQITAVLTNLVTSY